MSVVLTPDSIEAWQQRGFTRLEACTRYIDARVRNRLNRLSAAMDRVEAHYYEPTIDSNTARALMTVRDEAWNVRYDLQVELANLCAPWFEVRQ